METQLYKTDSVILRFLHFFISDNKNEPDKTDENDKLNDSYAKYYSLTEHLAVDEITVLFKVRVIFKHYIPKKHKQFGIKLCKLCDSKGYPFNDCVIGKDREHATTSMTARRATATGLAAGIEHVGHKLYMDSFSLPLLFDS
jgi:hypothetical protein